MRTAPGHQRRTHHTNPHLRHLPSFKSNRGTTRLRKPSCRPVGSGSRLRTYCAALCGPGALPAWDGQDLPRGVRGEDDPWLLSVAGRTKRLKRSRSSAAHVPRKVAHVPTRVYAVYAPAMSQPRPGKRSETTPGVVVCIQKKQTAHLPEALYTYFGPTCSCPNANPAVGGSILHI